jgi:hypothetical protein
MVIHCIAEPVPPLGAVEPRVEPEPVPPLGAVEPRVEPEPVPPLGVVSRLAPR